MKKRYPILCVLLITSLFICTPAIAAPLIHNDDIVARSLNPDFVLEDTGTGGIDWYLEGGEPCVDCFSIAPKGNIHTFVIENGVGPNLLYLDSNDRIGINKSNPGHTIDAVGGRIRLNQNSTPTARRIELRVDGAETDLQVTNADLFIRAGANRDIVLNPWERYVGVGTTTPNKKLHVVGNSTAEFDGNRSAIRVENTSATLGTRQMLQLVNKGNPALYFENTASGRKWTMNPIVSDFRWNAVGVGLGYEMILEGSGDLEIAGTLTQNSDKNTKEAIVAVDPNEVLTKVVALPISQWQYKHDDEKSRHLGPMAQDFHAAFGLGKDNKGIAPGDVSGVALAAIQSLYTSLKAKDTKIAELEEQMKIQQEQIARLTSLEPVVAALIKKMNAQGGMINANFNANDNSF